MPVAPRTSIPATTGWGQGAKSSPDAGRGARGRSRKDRRRKRGNPSSAAIKNRRGFGALPRPARRLGAAFGVHAAPGPDDCAAGARKRASPLTDRGGPPSAAGHDPRPMSDSPWCRERFSRGCGCRHSSCPSRGECPLPLSRESGSSSKLAGAVYVRRLQENAHDRYANRDDEKRITIGQNGVHVCRVPRVPLRLSQTHHHSQQGNTCRAAPRSRPIPRCRRRMLTTWGSGSIHGPS